MFRAIVKISGVLYLALLFYIFFLARRRPKPSFEWGGHHSLHLVPFYDKFKSFRHFFRYGLKSQVNLLADVFGNVVLFIPLAFILVIVFHVNNLRKVVLICFIISFAIEASQYFLRIGTADIDDLITNTVGAIIGVTLIRWMQKTSIPFIKRFSYEIGLRGLSPQ
ncbi:MAG: VanZ family protein [Chitinophagaceae bacterium]